MVRLGIIGAGRVAQIAHVATLSGVAGATIVALADLRPQLADVVARRWQIPTVYSSHEQLIADASIDAVVVVTQRSQTAGVVGEALSAGKHVLSEKPMALCTGDARTLVERAAAGALVYAVGYVKRHDGGVGRARDAVARLRGSGEAGALVTVRATMDGGTDGASDDWLMTDEPRRDAGFSVAGLPPEPAQRLALERFLNVFSHTTNLVRFVMGDRLEPGASIPSAHGIALTGHVAGVPFVGAFTDRTVAGWHERLDVVFERATLTIALPAPFDANACARVQLLAGNGSVTDLSVAGWAFARQAAAFVADVAERREPLAAGADAVEDVVLAETLFTR